MDLTCQAIQELTILNECYISDENSKKTINTFNFFCYYGTLEK